MCAVIQPAPARQQRRMPALCPRMCECMVVGSAAAAAAAVFAPELVRQVTVDLARFQPDPTRMAVLEARPLFMYTGNWSWLRPWVFFRSGFYVGAIAVVALAASLWQSRRLDHLLIVMFTVVNYLATVVQNRFGYYLVPASALVAGWRSWAS